MPTMPEQPSLDFISDPERGSSGPEWPVPLGGADLELAAGLAPEIARAVAAIDWHRVQRDLDAQGAATLASLLSPSQCHQLAGLYACDEGPAAGTFRSRVVMARHGFGRGEYKYFSYPLPDLIAGLRPALYTKLCGVANRWNEAMGIDIRYPEGHDAFLKRCHDAGQVRPTPL